MPMDNEETSSASSKSNKVVYTMSNYDDTRNTNNKPLSHNPVDYIQKARVTRAVPPKPAYDPLQFVQLKPCSLVKTAQEQIKRVENVKKEKEEKKEEPEEWQCNLDNWKSSRRKRVEHIIDRVVEVKKLELEEHDRNRRKSKTFNQMMEQRGSRRLKYLPIYTDEDNNDLTELGLSSCDKNDKLNENNEIETNDHNNQHSPHMSQTNLTESNEYIDAIEGYKSRVSRASNINSSTKTEPNSTGNTIAESNSKDENVYSEEILHSNEIARNVSKADFFKTKELFEKEQYGNNNGSEFKQKSSDFVNTASIKDRSSFLKLSRSRDFCNENGRNKLPVLDTSFSDLKNRLEVFEREIKNVGNEKQDHTNVFYDASTQYPSNSLNKTNTSQKFNKTIKKKQHLTQNSPLEYDIFTQKQSSEIHDNDQLDTDREDSGIHTTDVSCSVSQADEQNEDVEQRIEDYEANRKQQPSNNYNFEALPSRKPNDQDLADAENTNNDKILDDALEMAFQEIDATDVTFSLAGFSIDLDKRSQNLTIIETNLEHSEMNMTFDKVEPYYQVPKSQEPYYEIPKNNSIPLYENVDIIRTATMKCNDIVDFTITGYKPQDPPKEKPPPPPIDIIIDDQVESNNNFKRINSTKSIENAIRNNRSSFLGFESHKSLKNNNQISSSQKLSCSQELDGLQKNPVDINYLSKTRSCSDIDVIADMDRLHHLRQNSDLRTFNCNGLKESVAASQTENQQPILLKQHFECYKYPANPLQPSITKEENRWLLDNEFLKQEDSQNMSTYDETQRNVDQEEERNPFTPPIPPVKPLRSQQYSLNNSEQSNHLPYINPNHEFKQFNKFGSKQNIYSNTINNIVSSGTAFIPLHEQTLFCKSLHALTTAVESSADGQIPKIPDERALQNGAFNTDDFGSDPFPLKKSKLLLQRSQTECSPFSSIHSTLTPRASNNPHWLVQEAEQRRINQQSSSGYPQNSSRKSLPDSVIQTITQRVQTLGIGTDRRWSTEHSNNTIGKLVSEQTNSSSAQSINYNEIEDKVLSVSGKKKCSHCNNELGRGAAMVIESLGLLYHLKCFKCFVCHTRLGDGFNGTDVRVRKYKLHCQNCFSSEDGVKFSCV